MARQAHGSPGDRRGLLNAPSERTSVFEQRTTIGGGCTAADLATWHARPGALDRLVPPWESARLLSAPADGSAPGARVVLETRTGPLRARWVAKVHALDEPGTLGFRDVQVEGPFAHWEHFHRFRDVAGGAELFDRVEYRLPLEPLSRWVAGRWSRRKVERMFAWRHRVTRFDVETIRSVPVRPTCVAISGAGGAIGGALTLFLRNAGVRVVRVVRREARSADEASWDPRSGSVDEAALAECDALVHLAGEPIASRRWTSETKRRIEESRVRGTSQLARALANLAARDAGPRRLLVASGISRFGDHGDEAFDERSAPTDATFLGRVAALVESAAEPARLAGIPTAFLCLGPVLTPEAGMLARILPFARAGLGGPLGRGDQWLSWISLEDAVRAIDFLLANEAEGAVNLVSPQPVRSAEFARTLGRVLSRPAVLPAPARLLRATFGELADEVVLASRRAVPARLFEQGFRFVLPELEAALRHVLGR